MSTTRPDHSQRGFAIVSAIFTLVVLAALAGFIVSVTTTQNLTLAQDVQGARAYQAARAGTEWGIASWLAATPSTTCPSGTLPASGTFDGGFSVTVTGSSTTSGGINFCTIIATATSGSVGSPGYVERQLMVVVEGNPAP